jgi:hypothetical protein
MVLILPGMSRKSSKMILDTGRLPEVVSGERE